MERVDQTPHSPPSMQRRIEDRRSIEEHRGATRLTPPPDCSACSGSDSPAAPSLTLPPSGTPPGDRRNQGAPHPHRLQEQSSLSSDSNPSDGTLGGGHTPAQVLTSSSSMKENFELRQKKKTEMHQTQAKMLLWVECRLQPQSRISLPKHSPLRVDKYKVLYI